AGKLRRVADVDLIEEDRVGRRNVIVDPLLVFFETILGDVAGLASVGYYPDVALGNDVLDKTQGGFIELDVVDPDLGRAKGPRNEGCRDDAEGEKQGDLDPAGLLDDVHQRRVQKYKRNEEKVQPRYPLLSATGDRHGDRRRAHQRKYARRIRAALSRHVRLKQYCHGETDGSKYEYQRTGRSSPVRSHAVPRQVTRHYVQQAGHCGSSRKPEDGDGRDVIDRTEAMP